MQGAAYVLVAADGLVDVARRELVELLVVAEDDDGDVDRAQHRQLVGLFEQTTLALQKGAAGASVGGESGCTSAARGWFSGQLTRSGCGRP